MEDNEIMDSLIPARRRKIICNKIQNNGAVRIKDLSSSLKVASMTIRRDLEILEKQGIVERTYGGAIISNRMKFETLFKQKKEKNIIQKEEIGKIASTLIENSDTIFVNSGTTTLSFVRNIIAHDVKIITNNALVAMEDITDSTEIFLTGGILRKESYSLVGETAMRDVREVYAAKAIIGTDGISLKYGLTLSVRSEGELNALMINQTQGAVIVLADSSKFGNVSSFSFSSIKKITDIVTDDGLNSMVIEEFKKIGIRVHIAKIKQYCEI
jgi:DeoR/GlpR family transcriptional regulator of sugar metabolism